ncbi:hypothetical protein [Nocardioides sp. LS1]|nr:hypothetical protein [Nocardioides sp. LS1]
MAKVELAQGIGGLDVDGAAYRLPGTVGMWTAGTLIVEMIVREARR